MITTELKALDGRPDLDDNPFETEIDEYIFLLHMANVNQIIVMEMNKAHFKKNQ